MGYIVHHAIVVTANDDTTAKRLHTQAVEMFSDRLVTSMTPAAVNGYVSFLVGPDGSKGGWPESDGGDKTRAAFIHWLKEQDDCDWALVQYGDEALPKK